MAKPIREFSADVGQKSMGVAGPDYIEHDFDKLFAMLDPNKNLPTGEQGGIGRENMKPGAVDDTVIGDREIDDTQESTGNVGKLSDLLNWFANMIKSITGKSSWRVKPACTLEQVANSTIDGVKNIGGDIDFVAGTGMEIIPDSQNKKITFAAKNESIIPGPHAETHSSIGSDPITPESIGAETPAGAQAKINTHENKTSTHGATATPTASRIAMYDSSKRLSSGAAPSNDNHVIRKVDIDNIQQVDFTRGTAYVIRNFVHLHISGGEDVGGSTVTRLPSSIRPITDIYGVAFTSGAGIPFGSSSKLFFIDTHGYVYCYNKELGESVFISTFYIKG